MKTIQLEKVPLSDIQNHTTLFNTLTTDEKYSLLNRNNLLQHLQMQLYYIRHEKIFLKFFFLKFRNLDSILNIFKKKVTLIPDIFSNLGTPKNVVR